MSWLVCFCALCLVLPYPYHLSPLLSPPAAACYLFSALHAFEALKSISWYPLILSEICHGCCPSYGALCALSIDTFYSVSSQYWFTLLPCPSVLVSPSLLSPPAFLPVVLLFSLLLSVCALELLPLCISLRVLKFTRCSYL
jgi:hypothetical protein